MEISWSSLFRFSVPPMELVVRGTLIYWFIFILLRMAGRRDVGSLGLANILLLVLIADAAQNAMADDYKTVSEGMVLIGTLVFWSVVIDRLCYFVPPVRALLAPHRKCLVRNGVVLRRAMRSEYITLEELMSELRLKGIENLAEVRRVYIEETGDISALKTSKKAENRREHK